MKIFIAQTKEEMYGGAVGCTDNATHTITLLAMIRNVFNRSNKWRKFVLKELGYYDGRK